MFQSLPFISEGFFLLYHLGLEFTIKKIKNFFFYRKENSSIAATRYNFILKRKGGKEILLR